MNSYKKIYYNPNGMPFQVWGNQLKIIYPKAFIPYPPEEDNWHIWASFITRNKEFANGPIPSKNIYNNWLEWANDLVKYLTSKGI